MNTSILEQSYIPPQRPYSQIELRDMKRHIIRKFHLSDKYVSHQKCGHLYRPKKHGRKEKDIQETGDLDSGNCSVCWKISKTPRHLRLIAKELINNYYSLLNNNPSCLTYDFVSVESDFYQWLYIDFV